MTMMNTQNSTNRIYNFSAGPSTLPESVLEQAREDILNIQGTGIGVLEHSHRGATITEVFTETLALCRELAGVGDEHEILFLSGGGSHHAAMLAMNFLPEGRTGDYLLTGTGSSRQGVRGLVWRDACRVRRQGNRLQQDPG